MWFFNRIGEKTTWLGVLGILAAYYFTQLDETTCTYIATILSSLGGLIGIIWKESCKGKKCASKKKCKDKKKVVKATHDDSENEPVEIEVKKRD